MNKAMRENLMSMLIKKRGHENKEVIQFCNLCELEELSDKTIKNIFDRLIKRQEETILNDKETLKNIFSKAGLSFSEDEKENTLFVWGTWGYSITLEFDKKGNLTDLEVQGAFFAPYFKNDNASPH